MNNLVPGFLWRIALRRPAAVLVVAGLLAAVSAWQARGLIFDAEIDLLPPDSAIALSEAARRETFGPDLRVVVALMRHHTEGGVVEAPSLGALRDLHQTVAQVTGVRAVTSLANAPLLAPSPAGARGEPLLTGLDDAGLKALVAKLHATQVQKHLVLSPLWTVAPLYVDLDPDVPEAPVIDRLGHAAAGVEARHPGAGRVLVVGPAVVETGLAGHIFDDLLVLVPVAVAVAGLCLLWMVRRPIYLAIAVVHCAALVGIVLGGMALLGLRMNLVSVLAPVVLVPIGLSDLLHLFVRLESGEGLGRSGGDPRGLVAGAFQLLERPMFDTSAANTLGFLGFVISPIAAIRQFGLTIAAGAAAALLIAFTLDAALLALYWRPRREPPGRPASVPPRWRRLVAVVAEPRACRRAAAASGLVCVVAVAAGCWALLGLRIEDTWVGNFDPGSRVRQDTSVFERHYLGTNVLAVVVTADPAVAGSRDEAVRVVNDLTTTLAFAEGHKGALSATLLARAMDPSSARPWLPWSSPSSEQLEASLGTLQGLGVAVPRLAMLATPDLARFQIQVFVPNKPYADLVAIVERARRVAVARQRPGVEVTLGGDLIANIEMVRQAVGGQAWSQVLELATMTGLVVLIARSVLGGVVMMAPMIVAILAAYALMILARLPYGVAVSMFPTLAIGTAIEFAVHVRDALVRLRGAGRTRLVRDLEVVARGIALNGVLWTCGFAVLCVSRLPPNRYLGLLCSAVFALSLAATLLLLPVSRLAAGRTVPGRDATPDQVLRTGDDPGGRSVSEAS